jgi:hypothetical protein
MGKWPRRLGRPGGCRPIRRGGGVENAGDPYLAEINNNDELWVTDFLQVLAARRPWPATTAIIAGILVR